MNDPNAAERITWSIASDARQTGYLWALYREAAGEEWREWEGDRGIDYKQPGWEVVWRFHSGFRAGIDKLAARLEEQSIEELLDEQRVINDYDLSSHVGRWDRYKADEIARSGEAVDVG